MIVWGLRDAAFPPYMLERWRQALPEAQVLALEGAGHWPHEEEPERVLEALRGFLATGVRGVSAAGQPRLGPG
jgi:haloalkane dehalogenase